MLERIRSFQADRLVKIAGGDTPTSMNQTGKVVVHAIPLPSFVDGRMADIVSKLGKGNDHDLPVPLDLIGFTYAHAFNLDGYLRYAQVPEGRWNSYAQFFRNGAIEGVGELRTERANSMFLTVDSTNVVLSMVCQYLRVLKAYDMGLRVYVYLSLGNSTNTVHRYATYGGGFADTQPLGREIVALPRDLYRQFWH
jgi:hypothetical protein